MTSDNSFGHELKMKRETYGISQNKLAVTAGLSRQYINDIENSTKIPTKETKDRILKALEKFNPESPMYILIDYVRIRFPTCNLKHVIEDILKINISYMQYEARGMFGYSARYFIGDVIVLTSPDETKGILLELRGHGCRQFESYLLAQERSWNDFLAACLDSGAIMKRLDLAINDCTGILDIPELVRKCNNDECVGIFRSFKSYASGELVSRMEEDRERMGNTLYIGSLKSDVYFCIYEKDYEQYLKNDIPLEEAEVKNRFEIRLKNERAYYTVVDLLAYEDVDETVFGIINHYMRFVDKREDVEKESWELNERWSYFIGEGRRSIKLTTKPEPYTIDRTVKWLRKQVDSTLLMLEKVKEKGGFDYLEEIRKTTELKDKHKAIIKQLTTPVENIVLN